MRQCCRKPVDPLYNPPIDSSDSGYNTPLNQRRSVFNWLNITRDPVVVFVAAVTGQGVGELWSIHRICLNTQNDS